MPRPISIRPRTCAVLCAVIALLGCQLQKSATSAEAPAVKPSVTQSAPPNAPPAVAVPTNAAFRVKAGRSAPFTDSEGQVWLPDQGFTGGDMIERETNTVIANTKDPALYLTEHYGMNSFSCKIPDGKYVAKLYFAETFDGVTGPGQRVFSFNVQGHEFKDFDVWTKAGGPNRAYVETVPVAVTGGVFHIDFSSQVENPEINAVEIIPQP